MEDNAPTINPEELFSLYEQRVQEQTALIFALVGKFGGKVTLTQEDLNNYDQFNTVNAQDGDDNTLTLELIHQDR